MTMICSLAALLISVVVAAPALAQDRRVPASPAEIRLSYAPIVQHVQPAVVNVYAAKMVQNRNPLLDDPIFRRFFGVPGQQPEQMQRSLGSGVMVDPSGLVVTNVTSSKAPIRSRYRCQTSGNSRPRSFSRTAAAISRCCG